MDVEETRKRLKMELEAQFLNGNFNTSNSETNVETKNSENTVLSFAPGEPIVTFPAPTFEKPKMFMPKTVNKTQTLESITSKAVKGMAFSNKSQVAKNAKKTTEEIYDMQAWINTNPEGMETITYDENVMRKQLTLVKRKEWQDVLFSDVDWFMQIDLTSGIKNFFKNLKF